MNQHFLHHNGSQNENTETIARLNIMGVGVVNARAETAVATIDDEIGRGHRVKLAFLNAHGSNIAARDHDFRSCLNRFMVLNDGIGVDIAARILFGRRFNANLNGTDFIPRYLSTSRHRFRIFLLGGRPGIAERAAAAMKLRDWPHDVVGFHHGYFAPTDIPAVLRTVRASGADLLLVALGNPDQEKFVEQHFSAFNCELAICVGALFDFLAGAAPRAPRVMRRVGLEWLFRLILEPARLWRRYLLGNVVFLARLARARLTLPGDRERFPPSTPGLEPGNLASRS